MPTLPLSLPVLVPHPLTRPWPCSTYSSSLWWPWSLAPVPFSHRSLLSLPFRFCCWCAPVFGGDRRRGGFSFGRDRCRAGRRGSPFFLRSTAIHLQIHFGFRHMTWGLKDFLINHGKDTISAETSIYKFCRCERCFRTVFCYALVKCCEERCDHKFNQALLVCMSKTPLLEYDHES